MLMLKIAALVAGALYAGYAAVVYGRLRDSSEWQAEITQTRSWIRCTPPFCYAAAVLVPALPLIAEVACAVNGLLWPVEMIIRAWRYRRPGSPADRG